MSNMFQLYSVLVEVRHYISENNLWDKEILFNLINCYKIINIICLLLYDFI